MIVPDRAEIAAPRLGYCRAFEWSTTSLVKYRCLLGPFRRLSILCPSVRKKVNLAAQAKARNKALSSKKEVPVFDLDINPANDELLAIDVD